MAMRRAMMMMRRRRRAAAAAGAQQQAAAGAEEEDNDPLADIADMLHVQYGEEATDEELKAAVKAAIDQL
jgi:flagellar biosynthesis/type III secretory pathway M-ring protein FliF/YscJ